MLHDVEIDRKQPRLSIITATYNSESHIARLIHSLRTQNDKDFEWIVADAMSNDNTLYLLKNCSDIRLTLSSEHDFGIYDALNRAIKKVTGGYYIVIGSDDVFYPNAVRYFKRAIRISGAEVIYAGVRCHGHLQKRLKFLPDWLQVFLSNVGYHSVGTAFKVSLHERFGMYSNRFPIAADVLFMRRLKQAGISHYNAPFVAGEYGLGGTSSRDTLGLISENFRVQMEVENNKILHAILFLVRLIKHSRSIFG